MMREPCFRRLLFLLPRLMVAHSSFQVRSFVAAFVLIAIQPVLFFLDSIFEVPGSAVSLEFHDRYWLIIFAGLILIPMFNATLIYLCYRIFFERFGMMVYLLVIVIAVVLMQFRVDAALILPYSVILSVLGWQYSSIRARWGANAAFWNIVYAEGIYDCFPIGLLVAVPQYLTN